MNRRYLELNKLDGGGSHAAKRGEGPTATFVAYETASPRLPHYWRAHEGVCRAPNSGEIGPCKAKPIGEA